jgi:hypothetical protein
VGRCRYTPGSLKRQSLCSLHGLGCGGVSSVDGFFVAAVVTPSGFDHAHVPSNDESFDVFAVSVRDGSCSGAGGLTVLDAMGEGPSLFKADTAATSLR